MTERIEAVVLLDGENLFHPYGRYHDALDDRQQNRLTTTLPGVDAETSLRLGAWVVCAVVNWIDRDSTRVRSESFGFRDNQTVKATSDALTQHDFKNVSVRRGKNRADFSLVRALHEALEHRPGGRQRRYVVGSGDTYLLRAARLVRSGLAEIALVEGRNADELIVISPVMVKVQRDKFLPGKEFADVPHLELDAVVRDVRTAALQDRGLRLRLRRAADEALRRIVEELRLADDVRERFFDDSLAVAKQTDVLPAHIGTSTWRQRLEDLYTSQDASPELASAALRYLLVQDHLKAESHRSASFVVLSAALTVCYPDGVPGALSDRAHDALSEHPSVLNDFARVADALSPRHPFELT